MAELSGSMPQFTDPFLEALYKHAAGQPERFRKTFGLLTDEQISWRPGASAWSVDECIDHLVTTSKAYFGRIPDALANPKNKTRLGPTPHRPTLIGGWLFKVINPGNVKKVKTAPVFEPSHSSGSIAILDQFDVTQSKLLELIVTADGLNLNSIRIGSPVTALIRYSLADAFKIVVYHQDRHFNQAVQVMRHPDFPKNR